MNELISVIVPIYNVEQYLEKCICSILNQTYENIELILVDDGSTDSCGKICDSYVLRDNRVKTIHKTNGGLSSARNAGIDEAQGGYLSFIDSDDYIEQEFLESLLHQMLEKDSDICECGFYRFKNGCLVPERLFQHSELDNETAVRRLFSPPYESFMMTWNKLYKKELFTHIRFPEGKLHEDEFTTYKLIFESKKIAYVNERLYIYRVRDGSIMTSKFSVKRVEVLDSITEKERYFYDRQVDMKQELICNKFTLCQMLWSDMLKSNDSNERLWGQVRESILLDKKNFFRCPYLQKWQKMKIIVFMLGRGTYKTIKKIYCFYKKEEFICFSDLRKFRRDRSGSRLILIDTPTHGNLGDHAIVLAEKKFIKNVLGSQHYEFTQADYLIGRKELVESVCRKDTLLIHGGGFMGTLWFDEEDVLLSILKDFRENKIFIFPQTVFFEQTALGVLEKKRLQNVIKECSNIKIFLRDRTSYRIMIEEMGLPKQQCFLVPDIVTYLKTETGKRQREKILFCMRRDKEKTSDENTIHEIYQCLLEMGEDVAFIDTVVNRKVGKIKRKKAVRDKLLEFCSAKLLITDRIHGMLFAAVTGTPCIAMDNISRKVSGTYEWIQYLDYVRFVDEEGLTLDLVWEMLDKKECNYSNIELQEYYDIMKKEIVF